MRVLPGEVLGRCEVHSLQELVDRSERLLSRTRLFVPEERRGKRLIDGPRWGERGIRVLVNEQDRATEEGEVRTFRPPDYFAFAKHRASCGPQTAGQQATRIRLATSAL